MSDREQEFVEEPKQEVYDAEVELAPSVLLPVGYIPRLPARTTSRVSVKPLYVKLLYIYIFKTSF